MRKRLLLLCAGTIFSCRTDTGTVGGDRSGKPCPEYHQHVGQYRAYLFNRDKYRPEIFAETVKIYQQYKKYYDALKSVNNLVKDARKVSEIILMVGDVSEIYVTNFQKMLGDENFSSRRTGCHRFRLYQTSGREQRGVAGPQAGNQRQHPFYDRQGPYGRGG